MRRTDHGTWGLAAGVGRPAVLAAAARAAESARPDPLVFDPLAAVLVEAPELTELVEQDNTLNAQAPVLAAAQRQWNDYHAARAHFFDTFLAEATAAGIRQVVILPAGLDTRAFRLAWPDGTTVFELDRAKVLLYKAAALAGRGARPGADWRPVAVAGATKWPTALWDAGFNHNEPTAWLVEGLLPLPGAVQDAVISELDGLSAAGSRLTLDDSLGPAAGRSDPADWLTSRGWWTDTVDARDYLAGLSRPVPDAEDAPFALSAVFVTAEKVA